jgi:Ran GTPase-activating protein (RanGAP) involved in mRNA processing and transport
MIPQLHSLCLKNCALTDDWVKDILKNMTECENLKFVDISDNQLSEKSIDLITSTVTNSKSLVKIDISGNPIKSRFGINKLKSVAGAKEIII